MGSSIFFAFAFVAVHAATVTWTGNGNNNLWDNYQNWDPVGIPSINDDAIVGKGFSILVGTANGLHINSLKVGDGSSLKIIGTSGEFGAGGATFSGSSSLSFDGGAGVLSVAGAGKIELKDSASFNWFSGAVSGNLVIGEKASVTTKKPTLVTSANGTWENSGVISIEANGTIANLNSTIVNNGEIKIDLTRVETITIDDKSTGTVTLKDGVGVGKGKLVSTTVTGSLTSLPEGKISAKGVTVTEKAKFLVQEPSEVEVSALKVEGELESKGPGARLTVDGKSSINSFTLSNGRVEFKDEVEIKSFTVAGGWVTVDGTTHTGTLTTVTHNNLFTILGTGVFSADVATLEGIVSLAGNFKVSKNVTSSATRVLLDGTLWLDKDATLEVTKLATFWGPSDPKKPGKVSSEGNILFSAPNATFNGVDVHGGDLWVGTSTALLELLNATVKGVHLSAEKSVIKGQSLTLNYAALYGPKEGSTLLQLFNTRSTQCQSPCGSYKSLFPIQTYYAQVVKAL